MATRTLAARAASGNLVVGSANWNDKATRLIDRRKKLTLVIKGIEAGAAWEAIKNRSSREWAQRSRTGALPREPVTVAVTLAIVLGVFAVVGLGVVGAVCIYGIHKGYNVKAKHRVTGPMIWDHRLELVLVPPARRTA
jgi:hypothetical protein